MYISLPYFYDKYVWIDFLSVNKISVCLSVIHFLYKKTTHFYPFSVILFSVGSDTVLYRPGVGEDLPSITHQDSSIELNIMLSEK